jgi:hypothetical protein
MRLTLLLLLLLVMTRHLHAQPSPYTLAVQAGISHGGWNVALLGQYHYQDLSAYLGPSMSLNRGLPGKGPLGLNCGLNYHLPSEIDWLGSLVNLDYQLHFFQAPGAPTTRMQELHLSYGLEFHVTPTFSLVQQLGYGIWFDTRTTGERRQTENGYSGLVRLKAGYRF